MLLLQIAAVWVLLSVVVVAALAVVFRARSRFNPPMGAREGATGQSFVAAARREQALREPALRG